MSAAARYCSTSSKGTFPTNIILLRNSLVELILSSKGYARRSLRGPSGRGVECWVAQTKNPRDANPARVKPSGLLAKSASGNSVERLQMSAVDTRFVRLVTSHAREEMST